MKDWLQVGKRVVCIKDNWLTHDKITTPVLNNIYTIRSVVLPCAKCPISKANEGKLFLYLEEIHNPVFDCDRGGCKAEPRFIAEYFAPVRETSIEVFKRLLVPTKEHV